MKGNLAAWIVLIAAVFILLIYILYQTLREPIVWLEFYRTNDKQPYDLMVTSTLLKEYFPGKKFSVEKKSISSELPTDGHSNTCYFFIGQSIFLSDDDRQRLFDFVKKGNEAFISSSEFPKEFFETLLDINSDNDYYLRWYEDSSARMNFQSWKVRIDSGYTFNFIYDWKKDLYNWMVFDDSLLNISTTNVIHLGQVNDQYSNFIGIPYGKGTFYLHSDPIAFTNYQLKDEEHVAYAEKVFSYLEPANIYWDDFSKIPKQNNSNRSNDDSMGDNDTPLRYILSQPSLKWAWYVLLAIAALFMLFRTKRTRRIIPVLEPNTNSSLEYIQTISRLYFMQNDHRLLAIQQMKLFLAFIRNRYHLQTKEMDADFMKKVSVKSQIPEAKLKHIKDEFRTINNMTNIEPHQLIEFHSLLDGFYRNCK